MRSAVVCELATRYWAIMAVSGFASMGGFANKWHGNEQCLARNNSGDCVEQTGFGGVEAAECVERGWRSSVGGRDENFGDEAIVSWFSGSRKLEGFMIKGGRTDVWSLQFSELHTMQSVVMVST